MAAYPPRDDPWAARERRGDLRLPGGSRGSSPKPRAPAGGADTTPIQRYVSDVFSWSLIGLLAHLAAPLSLAVDPTVVDPWSRQPPLPSAWTCPLEPGIVDPWRPNGCQSPLLVDDERRTSDPWPSDRAPQSSATEAGRAIAAEFAGVRLVDPWAGQPHPIPSAAFDL